jgi:hypothetical protein
MRKPVCEEVSGQEVDALWLVGRWEASRRDCSRSVGETRQKQKRGTTDSTDQKDKEQKNQSRMESKSPAPGDWIPVMLRIPFCKEVKKPGFGGLRTHSYPFNPFYPWFPL